MAVIQFYRATLKALKRGQHARGAVISLRSDNPALAGYQADPAWEVVATHAAEIGGARAPEPAVARVLGAARRTAADLLAAVRSLSSTERDALVVLLRDDREPASRSVRELFDLLVRFEAPPSLTPPAADSSDSAGSSPPAAVPVPRAVPAPVALPAAVLPPPSSPSVRSGPTAAELEDPSPPEEPAKADRGVTDPPRRPLRPGRSAK